MNKQELEKFRNIISPIICTHMKELCQKQNWSNITFAKKLGILDDTYYKITQGTTLPSLRAFLIFLSLMAENERQVFIKNICPVVKEFKQQHLAFPFQRRG